MPLGVMSLSEIVWFYALAGATWLGFAAALGYYGRSKGWSFAVCFSLGLVTSPLVGWLIVTLLPPPPPPNPTSAEFLNRVFELEREAKRAEQERVDPTR